jgi:hypothetical protein
MKHIISYNQKRNRKWKNFATRGGEREEESEESEHTTNTLFLIDSLSLAFASKRELLLFFFNFQWRLHE